MKTKIVAILLAFFLGCWGIHQFYLGNSGRGVLYLIVGGVLGTIFGFFTLFIPLFITGILALIDIIIIATMSEDAFNRKYNPSYVNPAYRQPMYQQPYQQPMYQQPYQQPISSLISSPTSSRPINSSHSRRCRKATMTPPR